MQSKGGRVLLLPLFASVLLFLPCSPSSSDHLCTFNAPLLVELVVEEAVTLLFDTDSPNATLADVWNVTSFSEAALNASVEWCAEKPAGLVGPVRVWLDAPSMDELDRLYDWLQPGGRCVSALCRPRFRVAIVLPCRDRETQLHIFLHNQHSFLRKQELGYCVAEQVGNQTFNRAKLMNVGYTVANKLYDWKYLLREDIDDQPRHMSVESDNFGFNEWSEDPQENVCCTLIERQKEAIERNENFLIGLRALHKSLQHFATPAPSEILLVQWSPNPRQNGVAAASQTSSKDDKRNTPNRKHEPAKNANNSNNPNGLAEPKPAKPTLPPSTAPVAGPPKPGEPSAEARASRHTAYRVHQLEQTPADGVFVCVRVLTSFRERDNVFYLLQLRDVDKNTLKLVLMRSATALHYFAEEITHYMEKLVLAKDQPTA